MEYKMLNNSSYVFKRHRSFKFFVLLSLCIISFSSFAQDTSTVVKSLNQKAKIKILPNGYYRPETRIALGGFFLLTFKPMKKDTVSRWSYIKSSFVFTQNKQFSFENDWILFFNKEKLSWYGNLDIMKFPEFFYGIGSITIRDSAEYYELNRISHNSMLLRKINGYYFAGFNFDTQYLFGGKEDLQLKRYANVIGAKGYFVNGIGPTLLYDSRDNGLVSHTGWYNEVSINFHGKGTLSDYTFTNVQINSRKFIPFYKKRCTWASEVYMSFNTGTVPFRSNPAIGGFRFLRGYYTGRFRDKNLIFCQSEVRIPVYWKFGVVGFAGMGQLSPDLTSFSWQGMKYSAGGGIRFFLSKKENANIRIDYGITNEGGGLYMVFGEAF